MNFEDPRDANEPSREERWLDDALAHYSTAEPRPGLENRILANLEAHAAERRRRWMFAFAGALALLLFAVLFTNMRNVAEKNPTTTSAEKTTPTTTVQTAQTEDVAATSQKSGIQRVRRQNEPGHRNSNSSGTVLQADIKQEHFPADRPLSEQERLLLSYLSQTPPQEMEHVAAVQQELVAARQRWEEEIDSQERR